MTEYEVSPPAGRRRRWPWLMLLLLVVLAALGAAGFRGWQLWQQHADTEDMIAAQDTLLRRLGRQVGETQAQIEQLRERTGDLGDSAHQTADQLAALQGRTGDLEHAQAQLTAAVQGGRTRAQLIVVEQLLLIANDRAQLSHDTAGAATALGLAQDRLATLSEPKLFEVRKAIADERAALAALPQTDRTALALTLSSLIDGATGLPLRERPPSSPMPGSNPTQVPSNEPATLGIQPAGLWARSWASIEQVLRAVFVVRRTDKPVQPLLPPEEEGLLAELLNLKLESARVALLSSETAAFHGALNSAEMLLDADYRIEDPGVIAARAELESMKKIELNPPLPDLSRSLGLLRAYIDALPRSSGN